MPSGNPNIAKAGENTRWQPGQTGNVEGKPKGTKHLSTWIQEMLADEAFEANVLDAKKGLIEYKGAPVKAIVQVAITKAVNGDPKAWEWLGKYGFGQKLELANNPENPITGISDPLIAAEFSEFMKNKAT